ncbi:hypothetical protein ACFLZF_00700, partial [Nanoarchaeota archaeon]
IIKKVTDINPNIIDKKIKISSKYKFEFTKYNVNEIIKPIVKNINLLKTKSNFLSVIFIVLNNFFPDFFFALFFFTLFFAILN